MIIRHICEKCGHVLAKIERTAAGGGLHSRLNSIGGDHLGTCPRCGGIVRAYENGDGDGDAPSRSGALGLRFFLATVLIATTLGWVIGYFKGDANGWKAGLAAGITLGGGWTIMSMLHRNR
jgi:hypothetical protein